MNNSDELLSDPLAWIFDDSPAATKNRAPRAPMTAAEFEALTAEANRAIDEREPKPNGHAPNDTAIHTDTGLRLKRGSEVSEKEQLWLVEDFLPEDALVIIAGETGQGKTTACISIAADITQGRIPVVGGEREARNVIVLTNEDSESRIVRKLRIHGGDLDRLFIEDDDSETPWNLGHLIALETRIQEVNPALVIIDSLTTHKADGVKLNSADDLPKALVKLRKLATKYRCCILVIHHDNKSRTSDVLEKISGTKSIVNTARHNLFVAKDPEHPDDLNARVVVVVNTNLTALGVANYKFALVVVDKEVKANWLGLTGVREHNVLQSQEEKKSEGDAESFLLDALKDGREDSVQLKRISEAGFGIKPWTLHRAATALKVVREYSGFGRERKVFWRLPRRIDDTIDDKKTEPVIDEADSIKTSIFDVGSTTDDKNQKSAIDVSSMDPEPPGKVLAMHPQKAGFRYGSEEI